MYPLELGHGAGARIQGLDLILGHKRGHAVCIPFLQTLVPGH